MTELETRIIKFAMEYNTYLLNTWDSGNRAQPGPWADEHMQFPVNVFRSIAAHNKDGITLDDHHYKFRFPKEINSHNNEVDFFVYLEEYDKGNDKEFACKA